MPVDLPQEEWRVEVDLDDPDHGYDLTERMRSLNLDDEARRRLGDHVVVTRDGPRLFLYTTSEGEAREAERTVAELVEGPELSATVAVTRWHPVEEAWRDAGEPLPETPAERIGEIERREAREAAEAERTGDTDWDVRAELPSHHATRELGERLEAEGLWVVRRWRYLLVKALTEEGAHEIAARVRAEAPADAEVSVQVSDPEVDRLTSNPFAVFGGFGA